MSWKNKSEGGKERKKRKERVHVAGEFEDSEEKDSDWTTAAAFRN